MAEHIPQGLQDIVRKEVRRERARVASLVAQREDEPEFYRLEEKASALSKGSKEQQKVLRRLRRLEPPTRAQIVGRRVAGIGLVAAISGFAFLQGMETAAAIQTSHEAFMNLGLHLSTALSQVHINILNLGQTFSEAGQAVNGVVTSTVNTAGSVVDHATKTAEAIGADVVTLVAKPWRKPRRRGRIPL